VTEQKKRGIFSEIFHFLTSNGFAAIIGVISSIVLTRALGPQNKGILTSALVIPNIIIGFSLLGIRQSTVVNVGGKKYSDNEIINSLFYLFLLTSTIGVILCSIFFMSDNFFSKELSTYAIILILFLIPVRVANNYLNSFYLGKSHFKVINRIKWINSACYLLLILVIVYTFRYGVSGALLSLNITAVITSIILISLLFYHHYYSFSIKTKFNKAIIYNLVSLGIVYALAFLIIQLNLRADVLLLKYFKGNEIVGYYSIAVVIAESLWQFPVAIGTVMISRTANSLDLSKTIKDTNLIIRITVIVAIVSGIILYFIAPFLIPWIYGNAFSPSVPIVQTIIPGILFFAIMRIIISFIAGTGKPWTIVKIGIPALLINVLINILIIPLWGGTGAAIATDISYFTALIITLIYYIRKYNITLHELIFIKKDDVVLFHKYFKSLFQK
jgi:O-antigen/teichoic acid export membrane protein